MKYAVFDWDNTIRDGYTLFSWIDYLCEKNILDKKIQIYIEDLHKQYIKGEITHDQYAEQACYKYAKMIKGKKESLLISELDDYMQIDTKKIFPFAKSIFSILAEYNVATIIVSGAPFFILEKYQKELGIQEVFAFDVQKINGIYTGEVKKNFGYDKMLAINELIERYGELPYMGFGDSQSDLPLLEASQYPFCVFNGIKSIKKNNIIYISSHKTGEEIKKILIPYLDSCL